VLLRFRVFLPYNISFPHGDVLPDLHAEIDGLPATIRPPFKSTNSDGMFSPDKIQISDNVKYNGDPAVAANVLQIDIRSDSGFDRTGDFNEKERHLVNLAFNLTNKYIAILREISLAPHLRPISKGTTSFSCSYLTDDFQAPPKEEGVKSGFGTRGIVFQYCAFTKEAFDRAGSEFESFVEKPWYSLLCDAMDNLPEVGPAMVLAATALEVAISTLLDELAKGSEIPADLWSWIIDRKNYIKEPTFEEKMGPLLKIVSGEDLARFEGGQLWEAFKNIKSARNSFAHEGVARVGGERVSREDAVFLLKGAKELLDFLDKRMPDHLRRVVSLEGEGGFSFVYPVAQISEDK
jgi:hypothetical protein